MSTLVTVGIDAGATLCKLACLSTELETAVFAAGSVDAVRAHVAKWSPARVVATGGGVRALGSEVAGASVRRVAEFDAWPEGARVLAARAGIELPPRYLLVSLGTGTSVLSVGPDGAARVGGSALGGGALLGLARLLLDVPSFQALGKLARDGDRRKVDLLVGDIYAEDESPLPREITAASFGKLASEDPADLAHALVGLVGENIGLICGSLAQACDAEAIAYGGSTLLGNPALEEILRIVGLASGRPIHFLPLGAYCGAVGAAALADR